MGVAPTGAIFKGLTFDGESSKDYGIYITGAAVYNAPARDVEMFSIPGRNGSFALDRGRFENIEVTYPAGLFGDTEADFAQGISDFRNFLASRQGYVELSDDYNPGEYRMAVYKSGLDVTPEQLRAGEFDIVFECKPQRWLTSGEDEITVTSGGTITNPTLFNASPLLEVWGSGTVTFGGQSVTVNGTEAIGNINIAPATSGQVQALDLAFLNNGDTITSWSCSYVAYITTIDSSHGAITSVNLDSNTFNGTAFAYVISGITIGVNIDTNYTTGFVKGTTATLTGAAKFTLTFEDATTAIIQFVPSYGYDSGSSNIQYTVTPIFPSPDWSIVTQYNMGKVDGFSTKQTAGTPAYLDLDIGEAYKESGGVYVSLNNTVTLGATLPTLPPGGITFTFPNTVTQLKVIPRWWKV